MGRGDRRAGNATKAKRLLYGQRQTLERLPRAVPLAYQRNPFNDVQLQDILSSQTIFSVLQQQRPPMPSGCATSDASLHLASSEIARAAPTGKEYIGHVGVCRQPDGEIAFVGYTSFGPAGRGTAQTTQTKVGSSLDEVIAAVNKKLESKFRQSEGKGKYLGLGGAAVSLDAHQLRLELSDLLRPLLPTSP